MPMRPDEPPVRVGLIGPGRAGSVVVAALAVAAHPVAGWAGRESVSAAGLDRMERLLPGSSRLSIPDLVAASDLVLLAVPDAALAGVVGAIAELPSASRVHTTFWHLSGASGTGVLAPLTGPAGVRLLALHPAMTFTGTAADLPRLTAVSWACTGEGERAFESAHLFVRELGGRPVDLAEADRPRYHAALSHASNFLTVLQAQAADVLRSVGVTDPTSMLEPLTRSALANALAEPPVYTGPISRGDVETIEAHLTSLDDPDTRLAYAALSTATLHRLDDAGTLDEAASRAIAAALAVPFEPNSAH